MDESVVLSETINSDCDFVRDQIRKSERTKKPIPWSLLTKLLKKHVEGQQNNAKCFKGIVLGLEARYVVYVFVCIN